MLKAFVLPIAVFVFWGCARDAGPSSSLVNTQAEEVTIVRGYGDQIPIGGTGMRVGGGYFNFSSYDSIRISFTVRRSAPAVMAATIQIRVGPATYRSDSLAGDRKAFLFVLGTAELSKPTFSALTIFSSETDPPVLLSDLLVVGIRR